MRRRNPAVPLFLAAAGLGLVLVGYGISRNSTSNADNASLIHQDVSAPAPASTAPTVKGGSGVWTGDAAPVDASAESSAPCPNCDIVEIGRAHV